jgi:hypothetical protein
MRPGAAGGGAAGPAPVRTAASFAPAACATLQQRRAPISPMRGAPPAGGTVAFSEPVKYSGASERVLQTVPI